MQNENISQFIRRTIKQLGILGKLIAINTAVFLFFLILFLVEKLGAQPGLENAVKDYFIAPGNPAELLYKPWTLITHMFTHHDFFHFLFNMIVLFFSGQIFVHFFSQRRLVLTYIIGGLFAYGIHVLAYAIFPAFANQATPNILGASASIMAVFVAVAAYQPGFTIRLFGVFPVPLFIIAALYIIADLAGVGSQDKVAHIAHLGGALFGGLSIIKANASGNIMNRIERFILKIKLRQNPFKRKQRKPKMKVYRQNQTQKMTDDEYNALKKEKQDRIDAILEKISKKGYDGLTKKEKEILFNESKKK